MKLSDLSVDRSITAIMIFVALVVLGIVSFSKIPLDLIPDIEFPIAVVITEYEGVGPKEIESTVTRPIEENLSRINNVETVISESKEGISMVRIEFTWGTDMGLAISDIRERLDITKKFLPEDIETPIVIKFDVSMMPIMVLSLSGNRDNAWLREFAEDSVKNLIEQVDGVASAVVSGGEINEVHVELIKNRMDAYNITIDSVLSILRYENMNVAGGNIESINKKFTLRTRGEFENLDDIENVVVAVKNNTPIYLKDIARVFEAPAERKEILRLNGENGVSLRVNKQSDKNTVIVARSILSQLEKVRSTLPKGIEISPMFNEADFIENAITSVVDNAILGGIIAVFVVFIFLRSIRSSIILGLSIPISMIATFIVMYYFDLTLNMMSMGGLAIGVGMLIDNSIVILENIFRFREKGARPKEAAKLGADEMAMAITASTLTTICVFIPFLFTEGITNQLFKEMSLTISFSLLSSLVIALTLIPMLTSRFIKSVKVEHSGRFTIINRIYVWSEEKFNILEGFYSIAIEWALNNRKKVVLFTLIAIVIGAILLPIAGMEFMPDQDRAMLTFEASLPVGTNLDTTESVLKLVEKRMLGVLKKEEYRALSIRAGYGTGFAAAFAGTTDHTAKVETRLVMKVDRERHVNEIREAARNALADIPGVTFNFSARSAGESAFGMGGAQIVIEIYGYDLEESARFTSEIYNSIKDIKGLADIDISREEGLPEHVIRINRDKASKMGLNAAIVSNLIKNNVAGKVASRYRKKGKEYDIMVRLRDEDRKTIDDIENIWVNTPVGVTVPLGNIIDINSESGPVTIERRKQERVTYINCKAEGRALNEVVGDIQERISRIPKPTNFYVHIGGAYEDMQESFRDLTLALILAIILIYIIMASQFESFLSPFIIMFTIPTVIFGVMVFLFLTGTTFNVVSFIGVLMLAGIVVNNAIVLVDYANILKARGMSVREALIEAGKKRLRPIMMTTFTTIFALLPLAMGLGEASEMMRQLSMSVIGGMSSSFIFTLIFLPVVYSLFDTLTERVGMRLRKKKT
ncbi:MAG: efflux RND transporter permease subunit [Spirochaetota bacterium]|nr:efflux RND transporter permease subunit [Spirochaetota bacterium]